MRENCYFSLRRNDHIIGSDNWFWRLTVTILVQFARISFVSLQDLIDECHRRDIWVMVDVVANHMGNQPGGIYDFSGFFPFNHPEHYHSYCQINFSNPDQRQIEICRLANLPDLNQTLPYVRSTLLNWISNLTSNYGIDGYRVDTVRHVAKDFWPEFQKSAGVFMTGEVAVLDDTGYVADYQNYMDSLLNFPTFWALKRVFNYRNSMTVLANSLNDQRSLFKDVSVLGLFSENHDQPRFLSISSDLSLYRNLIVYNILGEGIPIIYYGLEQKFIGGGDPNNRESLWPYGNPNYIFYQYIKTLTSFRKQQGYFLNQAVRVMQVTDQAFVFTRGTEHAMIGCLTNHGSGSEFDIYLNNGQLDGIKDGTEYKDIFSSATYTVSNCQMKIVLNNSYPGSIGENQRWTGQSM